MPFECPVRAAAPAHYDPNACNSPDHPLHLL